MWPEAYSVSFQTLTGAGGVLCVCLCLHVRRPVQRLQVHILCLWQHLQKGGLTVKRVYSLWSQQTHTDPEPAVTEGRPCGQDVRPVRQSLQRPPRRRRRLLVEAEQFLDPESGAPVHRGGHLPDWRRLLGSPVIHAGLRGWFLFILGVRKHSSLLPCHGCAITLVIFHPQKKKKQNKPESLVQWAEWCSSVSPCPPLCCAFYPTGNRRQPITGEERQHTEVSISSSELYVSIKQIFDNLMW